MTVTSLSYPLRLDKQGRFARTASESDTDTNRIVIALGTQMGERVMRPDWGEDIEKIFFLNQQDVYSTVYDHVSRVFDKHFPHLDLVSINMSKYEGGVRVVADISWRPKAMPGNKNSGTQVVSVDISGTVHKLTEQRV